MSHFLNIITVFSLTLLCCNTSQPEENKSKRTAIEIVLAKASNPENSAEDRLKYALLALKKSRQNNNNYETLESERTIATIYLQEGSYALAEEHFQKALQLSIKLSDKENEAIILNNVGIIHHYNSEYDSALKYYMEANNLFRILNNREYLAQNLTNVGMIYKLQGRLEDAFKISMESVQVLESLNEKNGMASGLTTVAGILLDMGKKDDALKYNERALEIRKKENDSEGIAMSVSNIANIYRDKKLYPTALRYYTDAVAIKDKLGLSGTTGKLHHNIGWCYFELKDYNNAEYYLKRAYDLCLNSKDKDGLLTSGNRLAKLYAARNDLNQAKQWALYTKNSIPEIGFQQPRLENSLILSQIYKRMGKPDSALEYASLAYDINDSLFTNDLATTVSKMNELFKTSEKEKELILTRQKATADSERSKARFRLWGIVACLSAIVTFFGFRFYRKKQHYLFKQRILEVKQEALIAQLDTHFIGDTIDSINYFVENNDKHTASECLLRFSRLIRTVLKNSPRKMVSLEDDLSTLYDYFDLTKLRFPDKHLIMEVSIDEDIDARTTLIPPMILQILVSNALKHAFTIEKGGLLSIDIHRIDQSLQCIVTDNGIGRKAAEKRKNNSSERVSYGSELAEKLLKVWEEAGGKTSYEIKNMADANGNPTGTRAEFSLPFISDN